jgi:hypothetical protein
MCDRDDVQRVRLYSVINRERKSIEKNSASAGFRRWISVRGLPNPLDRNIESSRRKADAAIRLRSAYQVCAASTSRSAAGWKSAFIQPIEKPLPNLLPRDALHSASVSVEFGYAFLDFSCPSRFNVGIWLSFERFDKQSGERCPILVRKLRRFLPDVRECPAHGLILLLAPTNSASPHVSQDCQARRNPCGDVCRGATYGSLLQNLIRLCGLTRGFSRGGP